MINCKDGQDCPSRLKNELANVILWFSVHWGSALGGRKAIFLAFWQPHHGLKEFVPILAVLVPRFSSVNFDDKTGN